MSMTKWALQLPRSSSLPDVCYLEGKEGVIYAPKGIVHGALEKHQWSGQAWKYHRSITSYRPNGSVRYKSLASLKPESEEDFWHIMGSCRAAGIAPPSSFQDIFRKICSVPRPFLSETFLLNKESYGGWQENFVKGRCNGKLFHYDLRSAYRWAACRGLPDPRSVYPVRRPQDMWTVFLGSVFNPPAYAACDGRLQLWTREEVEALKLDINQFYMGWGFADWIDLTPAFQEIETRFPYCYKRISRAFWGRWNTRQPLEQISWKTGKPSVSRRENFAFNPVWSRFITARVKVRLLQAIMQAQAVHVFVDSVLSYEQLPTGDNVGDWVLQGEYDNVNVWGPGIWGPADRLVKHCGMTERQSLTFKDNR